MTKSEREEDQEEKHRHGLSSKETDNRAWKAMNGKEGVASHKKKRKFNGDRVCNRRVGHIYALKMSIILDNRHSFLTINLQRLDKMKAFSDCSDIYHSFLVLNQAKIKPFLYVE